MKELRKHFLALPLLLMTLALFVSACGSDDDNGSAPDPTPAGVVAVDLGLPSGTKWANMNIGASMAEDYGWYFAWGETVGYSGTSTSRSFWWDNYTKFGTFDSSAAPDYGFTKYNKTNGPTTLQAVDDAATALWGSKWKMPTAAQMEELMKNTDNEWATTNGVNGYKFMKKSDHSVFIFLPAAGSREGTKLNGQGYNSYYWSSSLSESNPGRAYSLYFSSSSIYLHENGRFYGCPIRPVLAK